MAKPEFRAVEGGFAVNFSSEAVEKSEIVHLTERQRKTLDYVRNRGGITSAEYQKLFDVKERQAQKDLTAMVTANLLFVEGRGPSTRYVVRDSSG